MPICNWGSADSLVLTFRCAGLDVAHHHADAFPSASPATPSRGRPNHQHCIRTYILLHAQPIANRYPNGRTQPNGGAHDTTYARAQRARRHARQRLSEARKLVRTGKSEDENAAYATVAYAVTSYLGDKLDLSAAGLIRDSIQQALSTSSVPDRVIDSVLACLAWADSGRFAPVAAGRKVDDLVQEAEEIIAQLEESLT